MKPCVLRALLTLMLALAIGASGPMRAFAHDHDTGLTAMVICGEGGATTTVYLDAAGSPVDPDKSCLTDPCSDCTLSKPVELPDLAALPVPPGDARALVLLPDPDRPIMSWTRPATARGPPN